MDIGNGPPVIEPGHSCCRKACGQPGDYQVSMLVFAPGHQGGEPARVETDLAVCQEHAKTLKLEEVLSDVTWLGVLDGFKSAGKVVPVRELTRLKLLPILKF